MTAEASPATKENLSASQFYMWRAVIAIAHAHVGGQIRAEERAYLEQVLDALAEHYTVTAEQGKAFADDLDDPQNVYDLMRFINDPECRSSVIYFGQILAWTGGKPDSEEEAILDKLTHDDMSTLDVAKLQAEIHEDVTAHRNERADELKQMHAQEDARNKIFAPLDKLLLRMGIDLFA